MVVSLEDLRKKDEEERNKRSSGIVTLSSLRKQETAEMKKVAPAVVDPFQQMNTVRNRFSDVTAKPSTSKSRVDVTRKPDSLPSFQQQMQNIQRIPSAADNRQAAAENSPLSRAINSAGDMAERIVPDALVPKSLRDREIEQPIKTIGRAARATEIPGIASPNPVTNFIRGVGDTATFGLSSYLDRSMGLPERAEGATQSGAGRVGQIAGGVVLPAGRVVQGARAIANIGRAAGAGAAIGVGNEAGEALTGRNEQTLGQRGIDVAISTGLGAAGGAVGEGLSALGQKLARRDVTARPEPTVKTDRVDVTRRPVQEPVQPMVDVTRRPELPSVESPRLDVTRRPEPITPTKNEQTARIDDADDIELPQPDEIAPRIRDRVNTFADDMIAKAREELAKSSNRLSSNPVDIYAQYAKIGAGYMLKGTVKLADFTEQMVRDFGEEVRPHVRKIFTQAKAEYKTVKKQIESEELGLSGFNAQELKDLSNINLNTADVYRNFRKVFGKNYEAIKKSVLDPFDEAKGAYATEQKAMTDKLYKEIVQGLGIRKGSKESALVQQYGEGQIDLATLKNSTKNWEKIVQADKWFRQQYDDLIDRVNQTVSNIYPNRPEKLVPKRQDYYRHFQEMTAWSGLKNLFDTASARISPSLSGISPYTQPKTKWASFKQKRGLGEFKNDAVGGFLDYIPAASYAMHIDPQISVFRNLAKRLAEDTEQTANINNFIKFVNNFANDLSGKTSPLDRWVEELGGRKALQIVTQVNNRVKSNTILGNVGSVVAQAANIPNAIAYGGIDAVPGVARAVQSLFTPNEAMAKSNFIKERYLDKSFRRFNQKWWEQPKRAAETLLEIGDLVGTSITWNTAYAKGVRQKVANPVKFADEQARRLLGGRGVGEQPQLIKSKVFNVIAPFQLEVNNMWRVMKDFVDEKQFGSLATLFAFNFLFNKAAEAVRGSGVTFDPIDAIYDAISEEDLSILQRTGRVGGEILSNIPLGQNLAAMYPEYGTNLYGVDLPTREQLFGEKDPTRFGEGLLVTKGIQDPIFKLLTPWGGGQLKKTIQGTDALARGGSFTDNILTTGLRIEEPSLRFPVNSNPKDSVRSVLFGPYATSQGKEFTKLDRRPLTEKQTREYLDASNRQKYYNELMAKRREDTEKRKAKEATNEKPK